MTLNLRDADQQPSASNARAVRKMRSHPYHRFLTGIMLGMILTVVCGWFTPLLAQPHDRVTHTILAQIFPDSPVTTPSEQPDSAPDLVEDFVPSIPVDIDGHWAADCLSELAVRGAFPVNDLEESDLFDDLLDNDVVLGVTRVYPEAPATWSVVADILNRNFPTGDAYGGATAVERALQLPSPVTVLYTYPGQYYDPDRAITRVEVITALAAKAGLPYTARANELVSKSLTDGDRVPDFGLEGVAAALAAEVLVNYPESQTLAGDRIATRGEVAALVCQAKSGLLRSTLSPSWVATPADLPPQTEPEEEVRGVWLTNIDSDVLFSQENLAEGIQRLKAMNINTLYPVVWNMGYTQYPSSSAAYWLGREKRLWPGENPRFERNQGDRDMLQELIDLAHAEGMAVIPWFEFGFMAPADYALRTERPEWFTQRQDGTQEIQMGEEVFTWMNPFHTQTQRLLLILMDEVLKNYDVEGIQVDDHLGLPVDMGYDPYTVALYEKEHDGQSPPLDYTDPEWMRWRADKITEFMGSVRRVIDQRKPGALLSVSPNPYPFSYAQYLQDWPQWEAAGWLDEIIVQVYRDDLDRFAWELNKPATVGASQTTPTSIGLLSGLRGRPTDVDLLTEQLEAVRDRDYAGVSYFFYQSLWNPGRETAEERNNQFRASFSQSAQRP
ncbi:family 10 glycosylhydrolase [Oscillatoria sp. CS-180]|uniref:glycoside hydrolase family 10 protein n=1 Tax=Oscillatoria sp. CS-180 TaxID=3021720 RepID=UPI00232C84B4|nr:family 10 glycosylhydrolase [Oscillatoria sp. CS-180]MDB9525630.1 family 10 glycosylhydrolase [Oscillatoria sp. CS-180]